MSPRIISVSKDFQFCIGHIGETDFRTYLNSIPRPTFVYAALPKPEYFSFWYQQVDRLRGDYQSFIRGLEELILWAQADEYHLEVNENNKEDILRIFDRLDLPHYTERPITYSAPINGRTKGMAKKRKVDEMVVFSRHEVRQPEVTYSHEYLDIVLDRSDREVLFDPVIGKGLLARLAVKYGHACYGIDMNWERMKCAVEYVERELGISSSFSRPPQSTQ